MFHWGVVLLRTICSVKDSVALVKIVIIVLCKCWTIFVGIDDVGVDGCILHSNRISSLYMLPMPAMIDWLRRSDFIEAL